MPTNLNAQGDYPLDYDDSMEDKKELFEKVWRNNISFIPPMDIMTQSLREKLKEFAFKVFNLRISQDDVQTIVNEAYEDGYEDGKNDTLDDRIAEKNEKLQKEV